MVGLECAKLFPCSIFALHKMDVKHIFEATGWQVYEDSSFLSSMDDCACTSLSHINDVTVYCSLYIIIIGLCFDSDTPVNSETSPKN